MANFDKVLFIVLPYVALTVLVAGSIYRYRARPFTFSSISSQFLEGRVLFWGSVPFHWGILAVFAGHLLAFLCPSAILAWNSVPLRLILLEVTGLALGLSVLFGLGVLFARRMLNPRIRIVTSPMDIVISLLLLAQVVLGCWIAVGYRWGSNWFASSLTPYLWSIFSFQPDIAAVSAMPLVVKLHIVGAFVIFALVPFSRLAHFLVAPLHYLGRPYQRVVWYWDRRSVRDPRSSWTANRPHNT